MALITRFSTMFGLAVEGAYVRIDPSITVTLDTMTFGALAYLNAQAREGGQPPLQAQTVYTAPYDRSAGDPFPQAYVWLKSNVFPDAKKDGKIRGVSAPAIEAEPTQPEPPDHVVADRGDTIANQAI